MPPSRHQPRELRRRVLLTARLRTAAGWSDACILNISSHGLMFRAGRPFAQGSIVELRHGDHVIVGRVVWRAGANAGMKADRRLPVEEILSLASGAALRLTAARAPGVERRRRPRTFEQSRLRSRLIEFGSVAVVAAAMSGAAVALVGQALARPLAEVRAALDGQPASAPSR